MYDSNIESIVSRMREQQLHWPDEPDMRRMTVSEMMALHRWLEVAETAPEFVAVGQA
ncbi:hypothetical protein JQN58_05050 [Aneurinibacillus sp. BA2021]|nr:hypothetical protein [Aneurinibacillus sp. BA2021]